MNYADEVCLNYVSTWHDERQALDMRAWHQKGPSLAPVRGKDGKDGKDSNCLHRHVMTPVIYMQKTAKGQGVEHTWTHIWYINLRHSFTSFAKYIYIIISTSTLRWIPSFGANTIPQTHLKDCKWHFCLPQWNATVSMIMIDYACMAWCLNALTLNSNVAFSDGWTRIFFLQPDISGAKGQLFSIARGFVGLGFGVAAGRIFWPRSHRSSPMLFPF